jgi:hypothetical protein
MVEKSHGYAITQEPQKASRPPRKQKNAMVVRLLIHKKPTLMHYFGNGAVSSSFNIFGRLFSQ